MAQPLLGRMAVGATIGSTFYFSYTYRRSPSHPPPAEMNPGICPRDLRRISAFSFTMETWEQNPYAPTEIRAGQRGQKRVPPSPPGRLIFKESVTWVHKSALAIARYCTAVCVGFRCHAKPLPRQPQSRGAHGCRSLTHRAAAPKPRPQIRNLPDVIRLVEGKKVDDARELAVCRRWTLRDRRVQQRVRRRFHRRFEPAARFAPYLHR